MLLFNLCFLFFFFQSSSSTQSYDPKSCSSIELSPGSRYTCNNPLTSCQTFIVYRSQQGFQTISEISTLFGLEQDTVLLQNNLTNASQILDDHREVLVPIQCSCFFGYFRSNTSYSIPTGSNYTTIACETFEGLVKLPSLVQANSPEARNVGSKLIVPLQCACTDANDTRDGFQYLVTYPIVEFDTTMQVAEKFGISISDLLEQNDLNPFPTIYPNTTILVPLRKMPLINSSITDPHENPGFVPLSPTRMMKTQVGRKKKLYIIGSMAGIFVVLISLLGLGLYSRPNRKEKGDDKIDYQSARSSTMSWLSPYLIAEMSKYSLISYSMEELGDATMGFSDNTKLGASVHKANFGGGTELVIKKIGFGDARRTISIHSKINHTNILKLEGVCYGDGELSPSYLVFEFAANGSLRDCLMKNMISWHRRTQIAFDVAIGLHYINHCTSPCYIHMNINCSNILITGDWRAKIANLGIGSVIDSSKERNDVAVTVEGWIAPEYLQEGSVSVKLDVFAFGVVLLEIVSGKMGKDRSFVAKKLGFLSETGSGDNGCIDKLREFVDPNLKDYPISETLCMTILAKACLEDDPLDRPSMDDILKILARMERQ